MQKLSLPRSISAVLMVAIIFESRGSIIAESMPASIIKVTKVRPGCYNIQRGDKWFNTESCQYCGGWDKSEWIIRIGRDEDQGCSDTYHSHASSFADAQFRIANFIE